MNLSHYAHGVMYDGMGLPTRQGICVLCALLGGTPLWDGVRGVPGIRLSTLATLEFDRGWHLEIQAKGRDRESIRRSWYPHWQVACGSYYAQFGPDDGSGPMGVAQNARHLESFRHALAQATQTCLSLLEYADRHERPEPDLSVPPRCVAGALPDGP